MVDRWPRAVVVGFALVAAMVMSAGCGSDEPDQKAASVSTDAVLIALVDWAVESDPPPTTTGDEPPVVYITASNGDTIDAAAQASVVAATADDATVRFADERSEAIDDQCDDQRVHDDGVLLVVGELPAERAAVRRHRGALPRPRRHQRLRRDPHGERRRGVGHRGADGVT